MKKILLHFLLFLPFLIYAQKEKSVRINPNDTATLYLSQIAEEVTPISLNDYNGTPQFVYLTDEYLYIGGISTISQLDLSGKVIKTVNCGFAFRKHCKRRRLNPADVHCFVVQNRKRPRRVVPDEPVGFASAKRRIVQIHIFIAVF